MIVEREFLVSRPQDGLTVSIREVKPGSCRGPVFDRDNAFRFARTLAQPAKRSLVPMRRRPASRVLFIDINCNKRELPLSRFLEGS